MAYSDRELLARLIQCEAGGEGDTGMKAVAGVVMNRVHARGGEYARVGRGSIRNIIFQPYHLKITDHALIVHLYRHGPGADAPGLECICHIVLPSFLIRLENRITQFFLSAKPGF